MKAQSISRRTLLKGASALAVTSAISSLGCAQTGAVARVLGRCPHAANLSFVALRF